MDRDYSMKLEFKEPLTKEEASFLMFSFRCAIINM